MWKYKNRRILLFIVIAVTAVSIFALSGCGGPSGSIAGYVSITPAVGENSRDLVITPSPAGGNGNLPLAGAVVTVDGTGRIATTSSDGAFRVDGLSPGDYVVTVTHGTVRDPLSRRVHVDANKVTQVSEAVMGRGYYLFIGINDYANITDLYGPENDVANIGGALEQTYTGVTKKLLGRNATKDGIRQTIAGIAAAMNPNDFFVLYYSGHGGRDGYFPGKDYICPYDTRLEDSKTVVTDGELADWLSAIPGGKVTVILDSCNSGAFADGNATRSLDPLYSASGGAGISSVMAALRRNGIVVLAASQGDQLAWERDGQGLFTKALVSGLGVGRKDADIDRNRVLTTRELYFFAVGEVAKEADDQDPVMWPDPRTDGYKYFQGPPVLRY